MKSYSVCFTLYKYMTLLKEELLYLSLHNQHLLEPISSIQQIVNDVVGIQTQYFTNAIHALNLRYSGKLSQQALAELVKTWTVRGTLHIICPQDLNLFISALKKEWFERWGKYLEKYFSLEERKQWQAEIYELIQSGVSDRETMITCLSKRKNQHDLINVALSSWGGILKDLAYQGKIIYSAIERTDFKICDYTMPIQEEAAKVALIEKYLVGYSPASLNDIAYWSQLRVSEVKKLIKYVKLPLRTIQDAHQIEYYFPTTFDISTCKIPKYIFLAGFDPLLLGYKNKERFLKLEYTPLVYKKNGFIHSVLLHNGQVIGIWKKSEQTLNIQFFESVSESDKKMLSEEIQRTFMGEIQNVNYSM